MKKILLIKLEAPTYSSIGMEEAFREHYLVESVDWQRLNFNYGKAGLWNEIMNKCLSFMPDVIFCQFQKDGVLTVEQWKRLTDFGFVINYTEDVREDISWYEEVGEFIGLTVFTNLDDVKRFKHNNVAYMMVSYNHLWYKQDVWLHNKPNNYGEIVFVGNDYADTNLNFPQAQERREMIKFMKDKFGDKFQAWGMGQENKMLLPSQVVEAYNTAKIVITHNNFKREGYCSDRGLNSIGCGAITIHQHFEGIEEMLSYPYFLEWESLEKLHIACELALSAIPEDRSEIVRYAKETHSWINRSKVLKAMIKLIHIN